MTAPPRPNLFVIGAMKSGTSYLARLLWDHPEVFMSDPKEPCYFVDPRVLRRNWKWPYRMGYWRSEDRYLSLFAKAGNARIIGEASTVYSRAPLFSGVPERILRFNPEARLIYVLRDPVQRAISQYWHRARGWRETRSLHQAIKADPQYVDTSSYAEQLKVYLPHFPLERIYVLTLEELEADPMLHIARLYAWLGVDATFIPGDAGRTLNARPEWIEQPRGLGLLDRARSLRAYRRVAPLVPAAIRDAARWAAVRRVRPEGIDSTATIDYLRTALLPGVRQLEQLLKRSFPEWTTLHGTPPGAPVRLERRSVARRLEYGAPVP